MKQEETFPFQVGADGVLHMDCIRIPEQEETSTVSSKRQDKPRKNYSSRRRSPQVRETTDGPVTARDHLDGIKRSSFTRTGNG